MSSRKTSAESQPFPKHRPEIIIKPSRARPFAVDFKELRWWFVVPKVGNRTWWAVYDPPDWHLSSASLLRAQRPAIVHKMDCVEIEIDKWEPDTGWQVAESTVYGRLTDTTVQWVATTRIADDKRRIYTFLDEGFDIDFGEGPRRLMDGGRYVTQKDGAYRWSKSRQSRVPGAIGAGMFRVSIGERAFTCLRVLDIDDGPSEEGTFIEAYLTKAGRTVLARRYNGRLWAVNSSWAEDTPWDERFPDHARIIIDGVVYVHWYDSLSHIACGIEPDVPAEQ